METPEEEVLSDVNGFSALSEGRHFFYFIMFEVIVKVLFCNGFTLANEVFNFNEFLLVKLKMIYIKIIYTFQNIHLYLQILIKTPSDVPSKLCAW